MRRTRQSTVKTKKHEVKKLTAQIEETYEAYILALDDLQRDYNQTVACLQRKIDKVKKQERI